LNLKPGTEVYSRVPENCRGTLADYALSTASCTAVKPASLSHVESAALPLAALTSLQCLDKAEQHLNGGLKGKTVYIPAGLSATGIIAIQLAKKVFGVGRVITTLSTSKISKAEALLGKGMVDQIVDYTKEDVGVAIASGSVDFLFDTVGLGVNGLHLMKKGGIIVTVTATPFGPALRRAVPDMPIAIRWVLDSIGVIIRLRAKRYGVEYQANFMDPNAKDLDRLSQWSDQGIIKQIVGRKAKFGDFQGIKEGCQEVLSKKGGIGKFVIEMDINES
jgi:NADPH:quinone reductase-like Zn-dependent oxidoreductase